MSDSKSTAIKATVAAALICALVVACGLQSVSLREERRTKLEQHSPSYSADVPPMVTFVSVSLGGFRGVIADILWLRVSRLQGERRYVELVQLSDWITKLEPHMVDVWVFHAWNMAYNVSAMMQRPEDRWRWVENGIKLLRDEGLPRNPRDPRMYKELGWIFQHKIGMSADRTESYYKTQVALWFAPYLEADGSAPADGSGAAASLKEEFGMDAAEMRALEDRFGPIDWRVPCAHSLYWASLGLRVSGGSGSEAMSCRRMIYVSLIDMARENGRLVGDPGVEGYEFGAEPATELFDVTADFMEETMKESALSGTRYAYVFFIRDAMRIRMLEGRAENAQAFYARFTAFFEGKTVMEVPSFDELLVADSELIQELLNSAGYH